MKVIRCVLCLFAVLMLTTLNGLAAKGEDSRSFLRKFTANASFQYSRIKFPLKSSITLLEEETLKEGKVTDYYRSKYVYQKEEISTR